MRRERRNTSRSSHSQGTSSIASRTSGLERPARPARERRVESALASVEDLGRQARRAMPPGNSACRGDCELFRQPGAGRIVPRNDGRGAAAGPRARRAIDARSTFGEDAVGKIGVEVRVLRAIELVHVLGPAIVLLECIERDRGRRRARARAQPSSASASSRVSCAHAVPVRASRIPRRGSRGTSLPGTAGEPSRAWDRDDRRPRRASPRRPRARARTAARPRRARSDGIRRRPRPQPSPVSATVTCSRAMRETRYVGTLEGSAVRLVEEPRQGLDRERWIGIEHFGVVLRRRGAPPSRARARARRATSRGIRPSTRRAGRALTRGHAGHDGGAVDPAGEEARRAAPPRSGGRRPRDRATPGAPARSRAPASRRAEGPSTVARARERSGSIPGRSPAASARCRARQLCSPLT